MFEFLDFQQVWKLDSSLILTFVLDRLVLELAGMNRGAQSFKMGAKITNF